MRFRPSPLPTVFVGGALVILVNLGLWQLRRHDATSLTLAEVEAVHDGPSVGPTELIGAPAALKWRRAELAGTFLEPNYFVTGRTEVGVPGFDVVAAFDVDGGPVVLVNRGWIPMEGWDRAVAALPGGNQTVHGLVLPIDGPSDLAPIAAGDGLPERWPPGSRADLTGCTPTSWSPHQAISARSGRVDFAVVVVEGDSLAEGTPKVRGTPVTGYYARPQVRPHLEYAATWFSIGGVLLFLWIYAGVRRGQQQTAT